MATRYYPSVRAARVRYDGKCQGTWSLLGTDSFPASPAHSTWQLQQSKINAGSKATLTIKCNQQPNYDAFIYRWVTPPLEAATLSGTFNLCFGVNAPWDTGSGFTADPEVVYKIHAYIAQGESTTVRTTIINNYVDTVNFATLTGTLWQSLAAAQSVAGSILDGDVIVIEFGVRFKSLPTPTPTYPPSAMAWLTMYARGANNALSDAVAGNTSSSLNAWFEFSQNLVEKAGSSAPANDACADAIVISSEPYESAFIDTTASADTDKAVWWKWTAPSDGIVFVTTLGANYQTEVNIFTGSCGALSGLFGQSRFGTFYPQRGSFGNYFSAIAAETYYIQVIDDGVSGAATNNGGIVRLQLFYQDTNPQEDDLYLPAGMIFVIRDTQIVNLRYMGLTLTGIAIDYTQTTMDDIEGGTNSSIRLLVGLHDYDIVEILDLPTLCLGRSEIDFIADALDVSAINRHPSNNYITAVGELYIAYFGNGYLYVSGIGTLPAYFNAPANDADLVQINNLPATDGDSQPGAPFTPTARTVGIENYSPWAITIDEANNILYYVSNGFYIPVSGETVQDIKAWDLTGGVQLPNVGSITLIASVNPGLRGLHYVAGVGIFVCNGNVVQLINASTGALIRTYTPSLPDWSLCLVDVKCTGDGTKIWVADLFTTQVYQFDVATGVELLTFQPYGHPGTFIQIAVFSEETPPPAEVGTIIVEKAVTPSGLSQEFEFTATGISPTSFTLADGEQQLFSAVPAGSGYGIAEVPVAGYTTTYEVSNASPIDNIVVADGETVTITVTNVLGISGGIYKITPGKRNDTIYDEDGATVDTKIPDPFIDTGYIGD